MSLVTSLHGVALTGRVCVPTLIDAWTGRTSPERADARLAAWSAGVLAAAKVRLDVVGAEHARGARLLVMSNHQSHFDIPVIFQSIPGRLRMVAKKELFAIPLFGRAMEAAGFVSIDRGDRRAALRALEKGAKLLNEGARLWIAPEGTRSTTGALGKLKLGGFHLARTHAVPILPVVIDGTFDVLPPSAVAVRTGLTVRVTVLPPVDPAGFDDARSLASHVEALLRDALAASRARTEHSSPTRSSRPT